MDSLVLNLITNKQCEIKSFLNRFYEKETYLSDTTFRWSMYCKNPVDCIFLLSALIDNYEDFLIEAVITVNKVQSVKITDENIDIFIRYLYDITKKKS